MIYVMIASEADIRELSYILDIVFQFFRFSIYGHFLAEVIAAPGIS